MNIINDEHYFDLLIDNNIVELYQSSQDHIYPINPKTSLMLVPEENFSMCSLGVYPYSFFPSIFTLNSRIEANTNIERIQTNPNFNLYGQGVIVGILDTGIDYQHKAFIYPDGTTRILSIWDQTIDIDNPNYPHGLYYGMEYSNEIINRALVSDHPLKVVPSIDEVGHGTMLAGIIGGNEDTTNGFQGIVPQCEFVIVKLKPAKTLNKRIFGINEEQLCYEETDIIAAITYITDVARNLKRPLALCVALGTGQGGHNGKGATSGYLNYTAQTPHIGVAIAAGNEGNSRRHLLGMVNSPYYMDFELNVDPKDKSFPMEIWVASPYRAQLEITSPNGETKRDLYPRINECRRLDFILSPSTIWLNNIVSESDTGDQLILLRFEKSTPGLWRFRIYSIDNEPTNFHVWLPSNSIISRDTYLLNSNADTTITSPGNADSPLTVTNLNETTGSIALDSSRGYTRYEVIKPDLAAPGSDILAPFPGNEYFVISGTGASAAHATGIIAMILEWAVVQGRYSTISGSDINKLLIRGAYRSREFTYPNTASGYGIIDIYGLFEKLI